jgi:DNA mismatch repair protein MutS
MRITGTSRFSLLNPADFNEQHLTYLGENTVTDLDLDELAVALSIAPLYRHAAKNTLLNLCVDERAIAYRQEILDDFLNGTGVAAGFEELLPVLARLHDSLTAAASGAPPSLHETLGRLTELRTYLVCVEKLQAILNTAGPSLHSQGLRDLRELLKELAADPAFQSLSKNLPEILAQLKGVPSVTIGINLDSELLPVEATLLSINDKPFRGGSLVERLMGRKVSGKPDQGIAPLHTLPFVTASDGTRIVNTPGRVDQMMVPLFRDLVRVLQSVLSPISAALKEYASIHTNFLVALEEETAFYLGAVRMVRRLQAAGLPMCRAEILPAAERCCVLEQMYNPLLALRLQVSQEHLDGVVVTNDVDFGPQGRIFILTGPNQGGKTVFTQSVGLVQVIFQAGLYVPAAKARISPVDGIYTHFATEEKTADGMGRLGEEAKRLSDIFQQVTSRGLVLLNESLSSTSPGESLYMAQDIARALRLFAVRAIYATHLHELADSVDLINGEIDGDSRLVSLVAGVELPDDETDRSNELVTRTYKIKSGPPKGHSYAKGIAVRNGISFEQLAGAWQQRREHTL